MASKLNMKPVDANFSLKEHIYEVLKDGISSLNIYDKDADLRLEERRLSEELGISRTPIREALARLEQEGFVQVLPRKGVYIRRRSLEEILEMITVWAALESMAARLATQHATDDEIASLRVMLERYSSEEIRSHLDEYSEANISFHQRVLELSKCTHLKTIADGLFLHMRSVRNRAMAEADRINRSIVDHAYIIEALEARNTDLAGELVREHTMRLHDHVRRNWNDITGAASMDAAARP